MGLKQEVTEAKRALGCVSRLREASVTSACTVCVSLTSAPPIGCAGARLANCQSRTGGPLGQGIAAVPPLQGTPGHGGGWLAVQNWVIPSVH